MTKKIYIAGPMGGHAEFNHPAFHAAQVRLETTGWTVISPAVKWPHMTLKDYTQNCREQYIWDLEQVCLADAIYMLKGWEASVGACGEHAAAVAVSKWCPEYEILYE